MITKNIFLNDFVLRDMENNCSSLGKRIRICFLLDGLKKVFRNMLLILTLCFVVFPVYSQGQIIDQIIDGDTFLLDGRQTVRMLGIDAPETGQPGYDISRLFLQYMTEGEKILLEKDLQDKDEYGRLLRYVFLEKNKIMINELVLYYGLADFRYISREAKYYQRLELAAQEAEKNKHGLWAFSIFPPSQVGDEESFPVIPWQEAMKNMNQIVTIEGLVIRTYDSGKVCFLNFHSDWQNTLNIVIFYENYHLFSQPPAKYFLNKKIRVTGLIQLHEGNLQMIIKSPQMIQIISKDKK